MNRIRAFTLIELLVVMGIISLLAGMLMPMYATVKAAMLRSQTGFVMRKVDTALRQFKTDFGVFPYQRSYPDLDGGETFADKPNNLYYRLGTTLDPVVRGKVQADMVSAATRFNYSVSPGDSWGDGAVAAPGLTYVAADVSANTAFASSYGNPAGAAALLNRMARERMRLAVLSGNVAMRGPVVCSKPTVVYANRTGVTVLTTVAQSTAAAPGNAPRLGWTADYLAHEVEARFLHDDVILDAWRNPLVYVNQTAPAISGGGNVSNIQFGMGTAGFDPTTGPGPGIIAGGRPTLLGFGRIRLSRSDAGDGRPTPADATWFPDASQLMHSDVRYYAATGFTADFELWSAGRDGRFAWMRDDRVNIDNISLVAYNKGLLNE